MVLWDVWDVCALSSLPPWHTLSSIPVSKVGRCRMWGAEMLLRGRLCGPREKPSSHGSGL